MRADYVIRSAPGPVYPDVIKRPISAVAGIAVTVRNYISSPSRQARFEDLVRAHSAELHRFAFWLCRDKFVAEDLVQETFLRAWRSWGGLREGAAARPWLYTILRNEHARLHERKRIEIDDSRELDQIAGRESPDPGDAIDLREALASLPESYREPLALQVLGGFSCAEIAAMMKLSEGAVMTRLSRARVALRKLSWQPASDEGKTQ